MFEILIRFKTVIIVHCFLFLHFAQNIAFTGNNQSIVDNFTKLSGKKKFIFIIMIWNHIESQTKFPNFEINI